MRCFRRHSFWRSLRRRLCAGLTLLAYVMTAFGVPLPADAGPRPCSGAACGCAGDECSKGSCCCSPQLAKPPPKKSCCTGAPGCTMPCCQHGTPTSGCPHDEQRPAQPPSPDPTDDDAPTSGVRWALGIAAMKCRGHSTLWVSAGVVLPAPAPRADRPPLDPAGWLSWSDDFAHAASPLPPVPPPRLAVHSITLRLA